MKKIVFVLTVFSISMTLISGLLFYQLAFQDTKTELENEVNRLTDELSAEQNITNQLETQVADLENRNGELQYQLNELTEKLNNATNRVKITNFSVKGWTPWVGLTIKSDANVTIHNLGINDVENLTLRIVAFGDESAAITIRIDSLQVGQQKIIQTDVYWY